VESGVDVRLLTPNNYNLKTTEREEDGVVVHRFRSPRKLVYSHRSTSQKISREKESLSYFLQGIYLRYSAKEISYQIRALQKKHQFNLWHSHSLESIIALSDVRTSSPVPKIVHIRDFGFFSHDRGMMEKNLYLSSMGNLMTRILLRDISYRTAKIMNFNVYIGISSFVSQKIANLGIPMDKIHTIYNPVTHESVSLMSKEEAIKKLNLKFKRTVLFVGRLSRQKGAHLIFEIAKKMIDTDFIVIGTGPLKFDFHKTTLNNIHYLGFIPPEIIKDYYKAVDVVLVPSQWQEPLGRVALEAAANSTSIVASNIGGLPETIVNGETGVLVSPTNIGDFINALTALLDDKSLRTEMGIRGRDYIKKKFDPILINKKFLRVYEEVLSN
jgi:glycosyltransferase involved in cell wall biosynthesis